VLNATFVLFASNHQIQASVTVKRRNVNPDRFGKFHVGFATGGDLPRNVDDDVTWRTSEKQRFFDRKMVELSLLQLLSAILTLEWFFSKDR
jgi:hypothetical protein